MLPPVSIVEPCSLSVEAYAEAGREVEVPRPDCPSCSGRMVLWGGYWRKAREADRDYRIFVPRVRCGPCGGVSHAVLPAFVLVGRLDVVESIGAVIEEAAAGPGGVDRAAERLKVPYTTARGWWRRFRSLAERVAVSFAALSVELGGPVLTVGRDVCRWALDAIGGSWEAASGLPGWLAVGRWRFVCSVSGGRLIATNTDAPLMIVGRRRFMPPVP